MGTDSLEDSVEEGTSVLDSVEGTSVLDSVGTGTSVPTTVGSGCSGKSVVVE